MRSRGGPATGLRVLLARDDARRALLLERVEPGTTALERRGRRECDRDRRRACCRRCIASRRARIRFALSTSRPRRWAETIPADWRSTGRAFPCERSSTSPSTPAAPCRVRTPARSLLHQDFHGGNVLCSDARGWLAIDPKPLVGDPAFDAASLLRDRRWLLGGSGDRRRIERRLDLLVETTGLDRERMRLWGVVHALAWGVSATTVEDDMVRCAELLAEA